MLVATPAGPRLLKLRGSAQGTGPLVAEVIVAALAEALGLAVPARSLVILPAGTPSDDPDDELADLLAASVGENLGIELIDAARDATPADLASIDARTRATVLWLDRLVLNPDRTARNPNLLFSNRGAWLIDHGAALRFQYDRPGRPVTSPRDAGRIAEPHVFADSAAACAEYDEEFARLISADVLTAAVAAVPLSFLAPLPRADHAAFLAARLAPPRAFALAGPTLLPAPPRRGRPEWLRPD